MYENAELMEMIAQLELELVQRDSTIKKLKSENLDLKAQLYAAEMMI